MAAECAADQNQFFAYYDYLFANQAAEHNSGGLRREVLDAVAREIGLDLDQFGRCLDQRSHEATIDAERVAGSALGVRGTPAVFINGQPITLTTLDAFLADTAAAQAASR